MFKPQTKDKKRIDELEKENLELKEEVSKLRGVISYLQNPVPYELSLLYDKQQMECNRKYADIQNELMDRYGMRFRV